MEQGLDSGQDRLSETPPTTQSKIPIRTATCGLALTSHYFLVTLVLIIFLCQARIVLSFSLIA
jgi:hypothetical protein